MDLCSNKYNSRIFDVGNRITDESSHTVDRDRLRKFVEYQTYMLHRDYGLRDGQIQPMHRVNESTSIPLPINWENRKNENVHFGKQLRNELHIKKHKHIAKACSVNSRAHLTSHVNVRRSHSHYIQTDSPKESDQQVTKRYMNKKTYFHSEVVLQKATCADKTTYCRPIMEPRDYIIQSIDKNNRLRKLVKSLYQAREREKHANAWNQYIKGLRQKHSKNVTYGSFSIEDTDILSQHVQSYSSSTSLTRNNLLGEVYSVNAFRFQSQGRDRQNNDYSNESNLYLGKKRCSCTKHNLPGSPNILSNYVTNRPIYSNARRQPIIIKKQHSIPPYNVKKLTASHDQNPSIKVQTDLMVRTVGTTNTDFEKRPVDQYKVSFNQNTSEFIDCNVREPVAHTGEKPGKSLAELESKLDKLTVTVNKFITELKGQNKTIHSTNVGVSTVTDSGTSDEFRSRLAQKDSYVKHYERPRSRFSSNKSSLEEILNEEINKSEIARRDIDVLLNKTPHPLAIIDIPTRDCSTKVTESFLGRKNTGIIVDKTKTIQMIPSLHVQTFNQITMAVNTDPLSLFSLFNISKETLKQIMSYIPRLSYCLYLGRPQPATIVSTRYSCTICGASFLNPVQLRKHVDQHNYENSRARCSCHRLVSLKREHSQLFSCEHCGLVFTRAHCCQLHEHACARRQGKAHDVPSNLLMLS